MAEQATMRDQAGNTFAVGDTIVFNDAGPKLTTGMEATILRIEAPYLVTIDAQGMERFVRSSDCNKKI